MTSRELGADPGCYACKGTGLIHGFSHNGKPCPCVALCSFCEQPIDREDYDEGRPRLSKAERMPACAACREE